MGVVRSAGKDGQNLSEKNRGGEDRFGHIEATNNNDTQEGGKPSACSEMKT